MTVEQALYQYVTGHERLSGQIGGRFYPVILPQNTAFPAGTYQRLDAARVRSHTGPSCLASPRFQVDWWASFRVAGSSTFEDVIDVAEAARKALDGYRGLMGTVHIGGIHLVDERDLFEADVKLWRRSQDYIIWHEEDSTTWL